MSPLKNFLRLSFVLGFFVAFFPWVFSYKGTLGGHPVSIRALGDVVGIGFVGMGVALLASRCFRERMAGIAAALDALPGRAQFQLILAATALYMAGVISHKLRAHYMIGTHALDLGFFSNICWNTLQGHWFYSSMFERNFMGVHVNWILWPIAFLYRLFRGPEVLLVVQAVTLAAAVPILWRTVQKITGSFTAGFVAAFLFVSSPFIGHTIANDFHPDVWQVPCLFLALAAWRDKKPARLLFFSLLAMLAKEDVSVVLCGFGVFLAMQREWRRTGAALFALSIGIFIFHTQYFTPRFLESGQQSILFSRYVYLGKNFKEMLLNLVFHPAVYANALINEPTKYLRFAHYFMPSAGLTFLSPLFLIPPIISVLPHILSQSSMQLSLAEIYSLPSQPFIFIGAAVGTAGLLKRMGAKRLAGFAGALFIIGGYGIYRSPRFYHGDTSKRIAAFRAMRRMVPPEASVAAQQNLLPHFDTRRFIQLFPIGDSMPPLQTCFLKNPDYIASDRIGNALPANGAELNAAIAALENDKSYEKIFERENFLLFKRLDQGAPDWQPIKHPTT